MTGYPLNSVYDKNPLKYSCFRQGYHFYEKLDIINKNLQSKSCDFVFLDFGCGTGDIIFNLAGQYPDNRFIGYDPNKIYIENNNKRSTFKNVSFISDFEDLKKIKCSFIYSNDVWHHINKEDIYENLSVLTNVLDDKGTFLVIEPNLWHLYIFLYKSFRFGERNFNYKEFEEIIAKQKRLTLVNKRYLFLLPNINLRFLNNFFKKDYSISNYKFLAGSVFYTFKK